MRLSPAIPGLRRSVATENRKPKTENRSRGYTLVELLIVIVIIGILVGMLVSGLQLMKRYMLKTEAKNTVVELRKAAMLLKRNYELETTAVGTYTSGQTGTGANLRRFTDSGRDFYADGIRSGDKLYITESGCAGEYTVAVGPISTAPTTFTVDRDFSSGELNLAYYMVKADGSFYPKVELARELDPTNAAWAAAFTPRINTRKNHYFPCKPGRIQDVSGSKEFTDPWGHLYVYRLERQEVRDPGDNSLLGVVLVEKVICGMEDCQVHAAGANPGDDVETEIWRTTVK